MGLSFWYSRIAIGNAVEASTSGAPTRTTPLARLRTSSAALSAARTWRSSVAAEPRKSRPALDNATLRVVRSNSRKPSSVSSSAINWLTACAVRPRREAATVKLWASATAMKASIWRRVKRVSGIGGLSIQN